jgi:hypothetical protein
VFPFAYYKTALLNAVQKTGQLTRVPGPVAPEHPFTARRSSPDARKAQNFLKLSARSKGLVWARSGSQSPATLPKNRGSLR